MARPENLHPVQSERALVIWGGDVNLGRRQHYRTAEIGVENVLGGIVALRYADLRIANLECVVATTGEQGGKNSSNAPYYFRARPEMLRVLTSAHIDIVVAANNHSGDYGSQALLEQGRWLDAVGIAHAGSGRNLEAALQPALRRAGNINVAVFSFDTTEPRFAATEDGPGIAHLDPDNPQLWRETLAPRIIAARSRADVVLVTVHWGRNHAEKPAPETRALARAVIDAGADAVLGSSAHLVQGAEVYRGRPILYDAGNLLFDSVGSTMRKGGIFGLEISPNGVERIRFIPIGIGFGYSVQLFGRAAAKTVNRFAALCAGLGEGHGAVVNLEEDNTGSITLFPPLRPTAGDLSPAPYTLYDLNVLQHSIASTPIRGEVAMVPEYARMTPIRMGPLTLLGLQVRPREISRRRLIWVESYWTCGIPPEENIRLNIRGVAVQSTTMPIWGKSMDHDPNDWLAPTSRWRPGTIYRDYFGLRPPRKSELANVDLRIEVGILSRTHPDIPPHRGPIIRLAIPEKDLPKSVTGGLVYRTEFPDTIKRCQPGQTWTAAQLQEVTGGEWLVPPPEGWYARSVAYQRSLIGSLLSPLFFVAHDLGQRLRHAQSTRPKKEYDRHHDLARLHPRLAGAMVSRPVADLPGDFPVLLVPDPIKAQMELGLAARQRFSGHLVAVTGTAGKSTTVAMLRHILGHLLGSEERVLATPGNYNTRIDALAILAGLHPDQHSAVIEVAQSALWMQRGPVTRLIRPTISVITEIGISQADLLVSSDADTARWKSRVFDGLTGMAMAVVGDHIRHFDSIMEKAKRHAREIIVYGQGDEATLRVSAVHPVKAGNLITFNSPQGKIAFTLPLPSSGMARNAMAALAVILAMGEDLVAAATALESFIPSEGCLSFRQAVLNSKTVTILDDSYNATVSSMRNAFEVFAEYPRSPQGRKLAVLGRIVHLGELAQPLHEELAQPLLTTGVELVITHGPEMLFLRAKLPPNLLGPHCTEANEVVSHLQELARDGDLILIKGSRRDSDFGDIVRLLDHPLRKPFPGERGGGKGEKFPGKSRFQPSLTEELLLQAATRRSLKKVMHPEGYFEIIENDKGAVFRRNSPDHSLLATVITRDKYRTKELLAQEGVPIPEGAVFINLDAAGKFFVRLLANRDQSLCVKPTVNSRGQGVTPTVASLEALASAWKLARRYSRRIVLETTVKGRNVRIMVLGGRAVGAYECLPVVVTGNGRDSIRALVAVRNEHRSANSWLGQWPATRFEALESAGLSLDSVPEPGTLIQLSNVVGITNGGDSLILADSIHPSLLGLAERAVHCFPGLHLACVSLLCEDPAGIVADQKVVVVDIEAKPAIADLAYPAYGPAQDLAGLLLDYALDLAKHRQNPGQPPCIRPALRYVRPPDAVFAHNSSSLEQQILRHAAWSRQLKVEQLSSTLTRISRLDEQTLFYKTMTSGTRVVARRATNSNKEWTKQLLRAAGLATPRWHTFGPEQQSEAWNYLKTLKTPAVIKPVSGSWGRGVTANVVKQEHFIQAWNQAMVTKAKAIMVEEYFPGDLYRLLVIGNALVAVAEILPVSLTGNGEHTIEELVIGQNYQRELDPCLAQCPIVLSPSILHNLQEQGLNERSILDAGRALQLDTVANVGVGGTSRDITDRIHPDFAPIAVQARKAVFDPPHVGIDLIARDIAIAPHDQPWNIIEINTNPALDLHHFPASGQPRDVAGALLEFIFPHQLNHKNVVE